MAGQTLEDVYGNVIPGSQSDVESSLGFSAEQIDALRPEDPFQTAYQSGFLPDSLLSGSDVPFVLGGGGGLDYINQRYGKNYGSVADLLLATQPGAVREAGGIRIPNPGSVPVTPYRYGDPTDRTFGIPTPVFALGTLGFGAAALGYGAAGAGTAAGGAGLGEGVGANAYFAGAQAPTTIGAGEFGLGTTAGAGAGIGGANAGLGLQVPATATGAGEFGLGTAGAGSTSLAGGATGYGLSGNAVIPAAGAGATGAGVIGGTALGRLLGLGQTGQDLLSVGGALLPAGLGFLGAREQSDAYRDVANQYLGLGAPFRGRLEESFAPDFSLLDQPGYGGALQRIADISARSANVKFGNPYDAAAQGQVVNDVFAQNYLPALANYRGQLGQFGGLGLNTSGSASLGGAGLAGGGLNAIGFGANQLLSPPNPLEEALRRYSLTIGGARI